MDRQPRALLFDMDGLLLDTERVALDSFVAACREHDFEPNIEAYYRCIGTLGDDSKRILIDGHGGTFPFDAIDRTWSELYHAHVDHRPVAIKTGALELLRWCRDWAVPCALATSTAGPLAARKLQLAGLSEYFAVRVTGDLVANGKPHPEPYLMAAGKLDVPPADCWALEDSENGVRAALSAGCQTIQVPDLVAPSDALLALGHEVVGSLSDVLDRLAGRGD